MAAPDAVPPSLSRRLADTARTGRAGPPPTAGAQRGAAAGALAAGPLADNFGRKRIIIAADVCLALGSILQSAAGSVGVLAAGRLIAGIGVGAAGMVLPVYLSECSPTPLRGRIITVF